MNIATYGHTLPSTGFGVAHNGLTEALAAFGEVTRYNKETIQDSTPADVFLIHDFPQITESLLHTQAFNSTKKIAYWVWESSELTSSFKNNIQHYDEIWTPSHYCAEIFKQLGKPVKVIPHFATSYAYPKEPQGTFKFLFVFDGGSRYIRKNPQAIIEAFKLAFNGSNEAQLIIKCKNVPKSFLGYLRKLAKGHNIQIIQKFFSYERTLNLIENSDCYVSLHHSEGFGLTLLEAMALGKPCITTNGSGNLDFTNPENSYLIDSESLPVSDNFYSGSWFEPCIKAAAISMKELSTNKHTYTRLSTQSFKTSLQFSMINTISHIQQALCESSS